MAGFGHWVLDGASRKAHVETMVGRLANDRSAATQVRGYAGALLMVATSTLVGLALQPRWGNSAVDLLYLPAVLAAATFAGLGPALVAALLSALAYNFFFTAPHLTFRMSNPNDIVTVLVLFAVATVTSQLASSIRKQARRAEAYAARNATIAGLARKLLSCTTEEEIAEVSTQELSEIFGCNALLIENSRDPRILASSPTRMQLSPSDLAAASLAFSTGDRTGRAVNRAVPTEWQFHPVKSGAAILGAIAIARNDGLAAVRDNQLPLLDNLLDQIALAIERGRLECDARDFARMRERDRIRSVLMSSIGQDLTPSLETISDAASKIRRSNTGDKSLASAIQSETTKLLRYISNLLDLGPDENQVPIEVGDIRVDLLQREVSRNGEQVHLTPKEYAVLAELAKHPGRVLTHTHLLRTAWGPAQENQIEYLRVAIRALRQKLERNPSRPELILNEPAVGYRLSAR